MTLKTQTTQKHHTDDDDKKSLHQKLQLNWLNQLTKKKKKQCERNKKHHALQTDDCN